MKYKKFVALFLISLIVLLPIETSVSIASISDARITGVNNVTGLRKQYNDKTIITASVEVPQDTSISPSQIRFFPVGVPSLGYNFDSCSNTLSGAECRYESTVDPPYAKTYFYTLSLFDDSGNIISGSLNTASLNLTIDNTPPTINFNSVYQDSNSLVVSYTLRDTACSDSSCAGICSGISQINFVDYLIENISVFGCSYTGTSRLPLIGSGKKNVTVRVRDNFDNERVTTLSEVYSDLTSPSITNYNLTRAGSLLSYISLGRETEGVRLTVIITEDNLTEVFADLSDFNIQTDYSRVEPSSCILVSKNRNICMFDFSINPRDRVINFTVTGKDYFNNTVSKTYSYTAQIDDVSPVVNSIKSNLFYNDTYYLGKENNRIFAEITESGAGFNSKVNDSGTLKHNVLLNLESIGLGTKYADSCQIQNNLWICYWNNLTVRSNYNSPALVFISSGSKDDAENSVLGSIEKSFMVYTKKPVVNDLDVFAVGDLPLPERALYGGARLSIKANVSSAVPVKMIVNVSKIVSNTDTLEADCSSEGICVIEDAGEIVSGPLSERLLFKFVDIAGNVETTEMKVDILFKEQSTPNYWEVDSITPMPKAIDKQMLYSLPLKSYFNVALKKSGVADVSIINLQLSNCTGDNAYLTKQPVLASETTPFIELTLKQQDIGNNSRLNYRCNLRIISSVAGERISLPEFESLNLTVVFYDGYPIDKSVNDKIEDAKSDVLVSLSKSLKFFETVLKFAEKLCGLLRLYIKIQNIWSFFQGQFDKFRVAPGGNEIAAAKQTIHNKNADTTQGWYKKLYKWCAYVSCDYYGDKSATIFGDWYNKYIPEPEMSKTTNLGMSAWPKNPKDSLILSMASGCIPGIIYNLKKYRLNKCMYVDCLVNQVPSGVPIQVCDAQESYATCQFVVGEMYQVVPFAHFVKQMGTYFQTLLSDPFSLVFGSASYMCEQRMFGLNEQAKICWLSKGLPELASVVEDLKNFDETLKGAFNFNMGADDNTCSRVGM